MPMLLEYPSLLAHTIYETLAFDASLLEEGFTLEGTSAEKDGDMKWEGLIDIVLGNVDWFETWLAAEKECAPSMFEHSCSSSDYTHNIVVVDQYNAIINDPDAWEVSEGIDIDGPSRDLRSTVSSRRIKSLIEQVTGKPRMCVGMANSPDICTDRYAPLPKTIHKSHFLISVQLPLLESYHGRIASSLTAFETLSSIFVRAVPGALGFNGREPVSQDDPRARTSGTAGSSGLCKAFLSASYMEGCLEQWGDELVCVFFFCPPRSSTSPKRFLQLWTDFHSDPILRNWANNTPLLPSCSSPDDPARETIFYKLMTLYHDIASRSQDMIVQLICTEVETGMRAYHAATTTR
jgi:hypothetical protein